MQKIKWEQLPVYIKTAIIIAYITGFFFILAFLIGFGKGLAGY